MHRHVVVVAFTPGQRLVDAVLEERAVRESGEGVVEGQMGEVVLESLLLGDVTEAPHPTDHFTRDVLGLGQALEDPTVDELQRVDALGLGMGVEVVHARDEGAPGRPVDR